MTEPNPSSSANSSSGKDSRLDSFLRQATALIAAEKGLTATCRAKLESLAGQLHLSAAMFDQAMEQLQAPPESVKSWTRYEQAFADFLSEEFEKVPGRVLSPSSEQAAQQIAASRYQLTAVRAEQIIVHQCRARQVSRVAPEDAAEHARVAIRQAIGNRTFLDEETRQQVDQLGHNWGLDELEIDRVALDRLAENRQSQRKLAAGRAVRRWLIGLATAGIMGAAIWWLAGQPWPDRIHGAAGPAATGAGKETSETGPPAWAWTSPATHRRLQSAIDATELGWPPPALDSSEPPALSGRLQLARQLVARAVEQAPEQVPGLLIAGLFHEDPSPEVADAIAEALATRLQTQTPLRVSDWRVAYRVPPLIAAIDSWSGPATDREDRWQSLQSRLPNWYPADTSDPTGNSAGNSADPLTAIAVDQWSQLWQLAARDPDRASPLVSPLLELTADKLEAPRRKSFASQIGLTIAEAEPALVNRLFAPLEFALAGSDQATLVRWIQISRRMTSDSDRNRMESILSTALGLPVETSETQRRDQLSEVMRSVRRRQYQPLMKRVELIEAHSAQLLAQPEIASQSPQGAERMAAYARASTFEIALLDLIRQRTAGATVRLDALDALLAAAELQLQQLVPLAVDPRRGGAGKTGDILPPTASDRRRKAGAITTLAGSPDQYSPPQKRMALSQLERVAGRFDDLPYDECRVVAQFLLSDLPIREQLAVQRIVGGLSAWNQLGLAFADEVLVSDTDLDQTLTMARLLLRHEFEIRPTSDDQPPDWRTPLYAKILTLQRDRLGDQISRDPDSEFSQGLRLSRFLEQQYRQRLTWLVGVPPESAVVADLDPLTSLAWRSSRKLANRITHRTQDLHPGALVQLAINTVDQLALVEIWLARQLSDAIEAPGQSAQWERSLSGSHTIGDRLMSAQRRVLKLLRAHRQARVNRLLEGV